MGIGYFGILAGGGLALFPALASLLDVYKRQRLPRGHGHRRQRLSAHLLSLRHICADGAEAVFLGDVVDLQRAFSHAASSLPSDRVHERLFDAREQQDADDEQQQRHAHRDRHVGKAERLRAQKGGADVFLSLIHI